MMRYLFSCLTIAMLSHACSKSNDFETPALNCQNKFNSNTTLEDLVAMAPNNGFMTIDKDMIFDAYVISSDQAGNTFKALVVQNKAQNPTCGIEVALDQSSIYTHFPFGSHVRINAKGLKLGFDKSKLKLGFEDPVYSIGRIPQNLIANYMAGVCDGQKLEIQTIVPKKFDDLATAMKPENLNQYICVDQVQFDDQELGGAYINLHPQPADTSRNIIDKNKKTLSFEFSQYAKFSRDVLPQGQGQICFILGKYNNAYQGLVNNSQEVNFAKQRNDLSPPIVGNALTFLGPGLENFESYSVGATSENFPKYINDAHWGSKYWRVANFSNNNYLQLSAYAGQDPTISYFMVPVDFTQVDKISFKTKDGYYNGPVLKVYYSSNYQPGSNITEANLVDITRNFNISKGNATGYATGFTPSGAWQKPATLNQKAYLIFEYTAGGRFATSTMQIDDLLLQ